MSALEVVRVVVRKACVTSLSAVINIPSNHGAYWGKGKEGEKRVCRWRWDLCMSWFCQVAVVLRSTICMRSLAQQLPQPIKFFFWCHQRNPNPVQNVGLRTAATSGRPYSVAYRELATCVEPEGAFSRGHFSSISLNKTTNPCMLKDPCQRRNDSCVVVRGMDGLYVQWSIKDALTSVTGDAADCFLPEIYCKAI